MDFAKFRPAKVTIFGVTHSYREIGVYSVFEGVIMQKSLFVIDVVVAWVLASFVSAADQGGPTLLVPSQHATIQAAITAAPSVATILVDGGSYYEAINLLGKDLQIISIAGPSLTVLDSSGTNDSCVTANSGETIAASVEGFTLTGGAGKPFPSSYGFDHYGGGVFVGDASSLRIKNCWIVDNGIGTGTFAGGVFAGGAGSHAEVSGCLILGNHAWASGGATLVDGNASMHLDRCTIYGNTANSWAFGHQGGVSMANGGDVSLVDCVVWGNAGYQIEAFGGIYSNGTSATCSYSCVEGGFAGVGNLASTPSFVDIANRDFHLQFASACIDAGDPAGALDPDGTRGDMGCFFYDQGSPVTALSTVYGAGCGVPALDFVAGSVPITGLVGDAMIFNAPTLVGGVAMGFDKTILGGLPILPLNLASLGMPGCELLHSNEVFGLSVTSGAPGVLQFSTAIPSDVNLLGEHVYLQAYCYAPGANPLAVIASNGIDWLIGNQ